MKRHIFLIQPIASALLLLLLPSSGFSSVQLAEARFPANQIVNPADNVSAEFNLAQTSIHDPIRFVPPTAQAAPSRGRSRGGASRGNCTTADLPLAALVPTTSGTSGEPTTTPIALTATSHPTFWFYVPMALTVDRPAEFLLLDENGNYVYTSLLHGTETAGIVKLTLPNTLPPLEPGKPYRWIFQLVCETGDMVDTWGEIQRIDLPPDLQSQLTQASNRDRSAIYATQGIWVDALTILAELRRSDPTNPAIEADWQSLLRSVNLADVVDFPLLPCCEAAAAD